MSQHFTSPLAFLKHFEGVFRKRAPWIRRDHTAIIFDAVNKGQMAIAVPPLDKHDRGFVFSAPIRPKEWMIAANERDSRMLEQYIEQNPEKFKPFQKTLGDGFLANEMFTYDLVTRAWKTYLNDPTASDIAKLIATETPFVNPSAMLYHCMGLQLLTEVDANIMLFNSHCRNGRYVVDKPTITFIRPNGVAPAAEVVDQGTVAPEEETAE